MAEHIVYSRLSAEELNVDVPAWDRLSRIASNLGAKSIAKYRLGSAGMLVPKDDGYVIALRESDPPTRQRFSLAHEVGHLLLKTESRLDADTADLSRSWLSENEEPLCDQLAAEILMPRLAFEEDARLNGWNLTSLKTLCRKYETSVQATCRRMVDLMPEATVVAAWKPSQLGDSTYSKLDWSYGQDTRYRIPNSSPRHRQWLVGRALHREQIQAGFSPVIDRRRNPRRPPDVPAEALTWGRGEYKRVLVHYFPERGLGQDEAVLSGGSWRWG